MRVIKNLKPPLREKEVLKLKCGDRVLISGVIYSFRDAAHKKLYELIRENMPLPFDIKGAVVYYMGPSPAKPGRVIGACGPTTSGRMDYYTPLLLEKGLKGMIGKGERSQSVKEAILRYKAVYMCATGGAGALLSKKINKVEVIAFPELGPEAIRKLQVIDFPAIVVNDAYGEDLYQRERARYKKELI